MGDLFVKNGFNSENGAEGAYRLDDEDSLGDACNAVISFRKQSNQLYASPKLMTIDWPLIRRQIENEFVKLTGLRFDQSKHRWTDDQIRFKYEYVRRKWWKVKRTAAVIDRPLFGFVDGGAILYAHTAWVKLCEGWTIKVGYTEQNISDLLESRKRGHAPTLLATTPGTRDEERQFHRKWRKRVASGNEWYWPEPDLCEYIARTFEAVVPEYWNLILVIQQCEPTP